MSLWHATTAVAGGVAAERLAAALERLDPAPLASGVHDRDDGSGIWEIGAYFDGRPDPAALALLAAAQGAPDFALAPVGSRDWMAQVRAGLSPVRAGRYVVFGSHDRGLVPGHLVGLEIEAALAFGTGHHETTQACLIALDRLAGAGFRPGGVADVGAGTGVLAMAAARTWPAPVIAWDSDALATATARANVAANRLTGRIACLTAAGFAHPRLGGARFDLVLANILAGPLRRLAPDMAAHLRPGGIAVLSGILARQAAGVEAVYRGWGFTRAARIGRGDWVALVLRRRCRGGLSAGGA